MQKITCFDFASHAGSAALIAVSGLGALTEGVATGRRSLDLKVFPSYARADRDKVQAIAAFMAKRHFSAWPEQSLPTDQWHATLNGF